jgi:SAM-dependent methyltransferase
MPAPETFWTVFAMLPAVISKPLFGDRSRFGATIDPEDPDWKGWLELYLKFYENTQKQGIGQVVNDAGYHVMQQVDLTGLNVLEIGPGYLSHCSYWRGSPASYTLVDIYQSLLDHSVSVLTDKNISVDCHLTNSWKLPLPDEAFDLIVSFYSLEHLYPLSNYLSEMRRVLVPGGRLIGAIPSEGGLAWGLGRFLTSRRYIKKNSTVNPDKIICWEHPNFASKILPELEQFFDRRYLSFWPFNIPLIDSNLVISFIYQKPYS